MCGSDNRTAFRVAWLYASAVVCLLLSASCNADPLLRGPVFRPDENLKSHVVRFSGVAYLYEHDRVLLPDFGGESWFIGHFLLEAKSQLVPYDVYKESASPVYLHLEGLGAVTEKGRWGHIGATRWLHVLTLDEVRPATPAEQTAWDSDIKNLNSGWRLQPAN